LNIVPYGSVSGTQGRSTRGSASHDPYLFFSFGKINLARRHIECGLIAAGISLAIIAVVNGMGTNLNDKFTSINNSLK
jgi:hypothetical protein